MQGVSGAPLDRGIPGQASGEFDAWAQAVQRSMPRTPTDDAVLAALAKHQDLCEAYRLKRDAVEIQELQNLATARWTRETLANAKKAADGSAPLAESRVDRLRRVFFSNVYEPLRDVLEQRDKSGRSQDMLLTCSYGPAPREIGAQVRSSFAMYSFWNKVPPAELPEYVALDPHKHLGRALWSGKALSNCPENELEATKIAGIPDISWNNRVRMEDRKRP